MNDSAWVVLLEAFLIELFYPEEVVQLLYSKDAINGGLLPKTF